jgi:hypothetical protein
MVPQGVRRDRVDVEKTCLCRGKGGVKVDGFDHRFDNAARYRFDNELNPIFTRG